MQFILSDPQSAAEALELRLQRELKGNVSVLWLVSGGSNIASSVAVMRALPRALTTRLSILLVDERYGAPGHAHSNWQKLMDAGFPAQAATLLPALEPGKTFSAARAHYEQIAAAVLASHDTIIAQLGMGSDGHIAGILPHSAPAIDSDQLVAAYEAAPYQRLTLTFKALAHITAAYVLAFGEDKRVALETLRDQKLPRAEQPAQFLRELSEVYLYNDQIA